MSRQGRWLVRPWPVSRGWVISMLLITIGDAVERDDDPYTGIGPLIGGFGVMLLIWTALCAVADLLDRRKARLEAGDRART